VQIERLRLINFRQHELTDLHLERGLIGIVGPNGAGKSTLLEAIAYALYGVPGTRGTKETLRRRSAPPRSRFEVTLEFTLGVHRYAVVRTLTAAELSQDGHRIATTTGAVTDRVTALLGMTRDEFFNTYFTGQKDLAVMAAMGRTERAQFLSRVIGYDRLRDAQERLRAERSASRERLAGMEQGLADPATIEAEMTRAVATLETARARRAAALLNEQSAAERQAALAPAWVSAQERRAAWQSLDGERNLADKRVAVAREQFRALDQQLVHALQARDRLVALDPQLREWQALALERDRLDQAAQSYTARSRAAARRDQARERMLALDQSTRSLPDDTAVSALVTARAVALQQREAIETELTERRTRWTQDIQEARTKLDALRDRYRELKDQRELIERQGPDGICPTCGRPLGKDYLALVDLLGRQMEEAATDGKYFGQRVAQLGTPPPEVVELESERSRHEQALRTATESLGQAQAQRRQRQEAEAERTRLDVELAAIERELSGPAGSYDVTRHDVVRRRLAELEPLRREHDQLAGVAQRAESLLAEAAASEQRASAAEAELAVLDERLGVLAWDPEVFARMEAAAHDAEFALQSAQLAAAATVAEVERAESDRDAALARQADRAAKAEAARRLSAELVVLDELDGAYSELRTELNLQLRPDLSERASMLLRDLTAGRYVDLELDEAYMPTVVEDGSAKPVISGGEEDVVNLALRLAISQLIAERAGQPLSLLVLDEIFGSLDEEHRAAVLTLLRAIADRFPQVILITHVEGMQDAFDRVIRMSYDVETGVTTVHDELPEPLDVAV